MSNLRPVYDWYNPGGVLSGIFGRGYGLREQRGDVVQTPEGPRIQTYTPDGKPKGLGYVSSSMDADLNPAAILESHSNRQARERHNELKGLALEERRHGRSIQDRQLRNAETQTSNSYQLQLADIKRQIEASNNQYGLLGQQIKQQGEAAKDSHALALATLEKTDATSNRALDLRGIEMQANIALEQDGLAFKREQLAGQRNAQKLALIGDAMKALALA